MFQCFREADKGTLTQSEMICGPELHDTTTDRRRFIRLGALTPCKQNWARRKLICLRENTKIKHEKLLESGNDVWNIHASENKLSTRLQFRSLTNNRT